MTKDERPLGNPVVGGLFNLALIANDISFQMVVLFVTSLLVVNSRRKSV